MRRRITLTDAARTDIERLGGDNARLAVRALALIELLEEGSIDGVPLRHLPSYGDLTDCCKVYFGATGVPTHRLVYRIVDVDTATIEIIEVVAVEQRDDAYVYLLAANRLARLPPERRKSFSRTHQSVIARRHRQR